MYLSTLTIDSFRCIGPGAERMEVKFTPALTAIVGANDAGKTAVIDALRFALGTSDQDRQRLDESDFHGQGKEITIVCQFENLTDRDLRSFAEYLTYGEKPDDKPTLYLNWLAENSGETRKGRPYYRIEVRSGKDAAGPIISQEARLLMQATYLRPLRDAEAALSAGRGSRLAQVLRQSALVKTGSHTHNPEIPLKDQQLSILGIAKLVSDLLGAQKGVADTRGKINATLDELALHGDKLKSAIRVSGAMASDDARLRELLEKLDLQLDGIGKMGLGSDNLLFMACELLLLAQEETGNKLLLIEEPEAHLHAQRQLQVMKSLQERARAEGIQVIITTHSPNLASAISLENLVIVRRRRAFSLASGETELEGSDRSFLERFLDVTKANLFFAYGVMIVEGDAENVLLPTLARLIGRDLTEHGVSIVNVGGVGLGRYARIFKRKLPTKQGELGIRVACITDMDVMPDCAPVLIGKVEEGKPWPEIGKRRWRAKQDIGDDAALAAHRAGKKTKFDGQAVVTFVSNEWTLEYDLALGVKGPNGKFSCALAEDVFVAAYLAASDEGINGGKLTLLEAERGALEKYATLKASIVAPGTGSLEEVLAASIYAEFAGGVSKPIAAQYLAARLQAKQVSGNLTPEQLRAALPKYLTDAIDYVTPVDMPSSAPAP
ncbi:ATP-dependent endonuclease [Opitutaceae bacterium TAV4]|nr:ATP-dependent endonuclease [Opitutaceae bacterium TAV4]RRJ99731.1 ATP-dependent endonuclease [Opitutaceae bacterium TAV3]